MSRTIRVILVLLLVITALFHIFTPLTGDILEAIGSAHISHEIGAFPQNIINQWNLRGIGHKFAAYVLFLVASALHGGFVPSPTFEALYNFASLVVAWTLLGLCAVAARAYLQRFQLKGLEAFYISAAGLTLCSWVVIGQPEYHVALLVVAAVGFGLSDKAWLQVLAGVMLAMTVFPKGVTILSGLGGFFLLSGLRSVNGGLRPVIPVAAGAAVACTVFLAGYLFVFPQEIADLRRMSLTEGALDRGLLERVRAFAVTFVFISLPHIPIAVFGLAGGGLAAWWIVGGRRWVTAILLLAAIAVTCLPPLVQGKYFPYHHAVILPLYVIGAVYLYRALLAVSGPHAVVALVALPLILMGILCMPMLTPYQRWETNIFKLRSGRAQAYVQWERFRSDLRWNPARPVLYLSIGEPLYYLANPSHLRYYIPHPLQRDNPRLNSSDFRKEVLANTLVFDGDYVLLNNVWLDLSRPDLTALREWLYAGYEQVYTVDTQLFTGGGFRWFPGVNLTAWQKKGLKPSTGPGQ
jgi:hypothetical protein